MDLQPHSEPELTVVSTTNNAAYAGAFFPGASGFTIGGGTFTSNNHNVTNNIYNLPLGNEPPSAFRTILLGDINLMKEIRLEGESRFVGRQRGGVRVRRMYSAKLEGRESGRMTVAMYQGDGAEEEWRKHVARYESIRHPNIMQLYGLVRTKGLCAMVFHDDVIPFEQFLNRFKHSPILTAYIWGYCSTEFNDVLDYSHAARQDFWSWTLWIRPATGGLSVDFSRSLITGINVQHLDRHSDVPHLENILLDDPDAEAVVLSNLGLDEYHEMYCHLPMAKFRRFGISTHLGPIQLGTTIFRLNSQHMTMLRITQPLCLQHRNLRWNNLWNGGEFEEDGEVLANSWIRYDSRQVSYHGSLTLVVTYYNDRDALSWLAQANHIFARVQETPHFEDYVCMDQIDFHVQFLPNTRSARGPRGYLFVCPAEHFQTGPDSVQWPDFPAYWSLDPSGAVRLSSKDAKTLGFPIIHIETGISGYSWDSAVYEVLRRFHQSKGLNPGSQETAIHLSYPLFELLADVEAPLQYHETEGWLCNYEDREHCREFGHYL